MLYFSGIVAVADDSLGTDKSVLLALKSFLETQNPVNRGQYSEWIDSPSSTPCKWRGIRCSSGAGGGSRVISVKLHNNNISGDMFPRFSSLTELSELDLSSNTIGGEIPADLSRCRSLVSLNLSRNILTGELNLTGLTKLEVLDLSVNRIVGELRPSFPAMCEKLAVARLSGNRFSGGIDNGLFDECRNLRELDLSANRFKGGLWGGFARLPHFSVSQNLISGNVSASMLPGNCRLESLDVSENLLEGELAKEISNCKGLRVLNLGGNKFRGVVPGEIGVMTNLRSLILGNNSFSRELPESLLDCTQLEFLDMGKNKFGGEVQEIFGRLVQLRALILNGNSYTGGIKAPAAILKLPNLTRLDLSYNNFSGPLPIQISEMRSLELLILAHNSFSGSLPREYGNLPHLQALDLSFNRLTGSIPPEIGNARSLLWLMLANNSLTGRIPPEIGNCSSLLWLNLANNRLSGPIPPELALIGRDPWPTFQANRGRGKVELSGSGECLTMRRWIPADYPPFSFLYTLFTRATCRSLWNRVLKGYGLYAICAANGSSVRQLQRAGYVQLTGNLFSGEIPLQIGGMKNFALLHLGINGFQGRLPPEIAQIPLVVLNVSRNNFSGDIPEVLGNLRCLQNLDLSHNNFSGNFPASLANLSDLTKFNVSYNPYITGVVPPTAQLSTFEKNSYLGDPLLVLPPFINSTSSLPPPPSPPPVEKSGKQSKYTFLLVFACGTLLSLLCVALFFSRRGWVNPPRDSPAFLLQESKRRKSFVLSSLGASSPWLTGGVNVKVIRLDTRVFTHTDILKATSNFSEDRIVGKGGYGTVYRGVLPDGREVAVKKLQSDGVEGEKEFRAEMEVLAGNGLGWPHPNLVTLYGWCLNGREKLLVYEYMQGGSLEELVTDRRRLGWRLRLDVAVDVARALVFLHHECFSAIVHRDVKASNVLLDKKGKARVTDFGLARVVDGGTHVSTMVAGTVGYVAPEYCQTWQATTKGDVYSFGVLLMELATGRRALDVGEEECLVERVRRVAAERRGQEAELVGLLGWGPAEGAEEMCKLLRIGIRCTAEAPQARPNMKEVLAMLLNVSNPNGDFRFCWSPPSYGRGS